VIEKPVRVAVLVSGGGTNLQSLLDALHDSTLARIARVISNRPDSGAIARAGQAAVPTTVLRDPNDANELLAALQGLKLVPPPVVSQFRGRMINIHPALLPEFGGPGMYGQRVHAAVLASGATESGATVHFVDEAFDRGAIIAQERVRIEPGDTPERLAARVLEAEHRLLPKVVLQLAKELA